MRLMPQPSYARWCHPVWMLIVYSNNPVYHKIDMQFCCPIFLLACMCPPFLILPPLLDEEECNLSIKSTFSAAISPAISPPYQVDAYLGRDYPTPSTEGRKSSSLSIMNFVYIDADALDTMINWYDAPFGSDVSFRWSSTDTLLICHRHVKRGHTLEENSYVVVRTGLSSHWNACILKCFVLQQWCDGQYALDICAPIWRWKLCVVWSITDHRRNTDGSICRHLGSRWSVAPCRQDSLSRWCAYKVFDDAAVMWWQNAFIFTSQTHEIKKRSDGHALDLMVLFYIVICY